MSYADSKNVAVAIEIKNTSIPIAIMRIEKKDRANFSIVKN